jgi:hypothetical protein
MFAGRVTDERIYGLKRPTPMVHGSSLTVKGRERGILFSTHSLAALVDPREDWVIP